jgi:hypothetical protein
MTTKIVSKVTTLLLLIAVATVVVLDLTRCTDEEQQKMIAQQAKQAREQRQEALATPVPEASPEPTTVPEPEPTEAPLEPDKVVLYKLRSTALVDCFCHQQTACGVDFWRCTNGTTYECMHDVRYSTEEVLATEENSQPCTN